VLWIEDGLSQRELSVRVGMMEPTTVIALRGMEKAGLIRRVRSDHDKRKTHVWLTPKGRKLQGQLIPVVRRIVAEAEADIPRRDLELFREVIARMTRNLDRHRG
jgi:MarR family transcriptional regulator, organic hydroperoxide resistance regulator